MIIISRVTNLECDVGSTTFCKERSGKQMQIVNVKL